MFSKLASKCSIIAISCCLGVVGSSAILPVRFVTYVSKPHSQTPCVTRRLDGPERLGSIAWVYSVVLTDGWLTTSPRRFSHLLLFTPTNYYYKQLTHNMVALPQQLTPLCLLVSPATASLKTPQIPLHPSSFTQPLYTTSLHYATL